MFNNVASGTQIILMNRWTGGERERSKKELSKKKRKKTMVIESRKPIIEIDQKELKKEFQKQWNELGFDLMSLQFYKFEAPETPKKKEENIDADGKCLNNESPISNHEDFTPNDQEFNIFTPDDTGSSWFSECNKTTLGSRTNQFGKEENSF